MAQITRPVAAEGFLPARRVRFHALDASKRLPSAESAPSADKQQWFLASLGRVEHAVEDHDLLPDLLGQAEGQVLDVPHRREGRGIIEVLHVQRRQL